jgi:hypothetical protein
LVALKKDIPVCLVDKLETGENFCPNHLPTLLPQLLKNGFNVWWGKYDVTQPMVVKHTQLTLSGSLTPVFPAGLPVPK